MRRLHERGVEMISAGRLQVPHRLRKHFGKVVHRGGRFEALSSPEQHFKLTLRAVQNVYAHAGRAAAKHGPGAKKTPRPAATMLSRLSRELPTCRNVGSNPSPRWQTLRTTPM